MRVLRLLSFLFLASGCLAGFAAQAQVFDEDGVEAARSGESFPGPGQVVVRLNGRVRFYADYLPRSGQATSVPLAASNTPSAANGNTSNGAGSNKIGGYGFQAYARLYPGFDGMTSGGFKYGASMEIRTGSPNVVNAISGQPVSAAGGGTSGPISAQDVGRSVLFIRRVFGYVGTDKLGVLRMGGTDGPTSLYATGTFENFADGGFNGDMVQELPQAQQLFWPFSTSGNEYSTLKAVYLSPQYAGFDGAISFEPSTASASTGFGQGSTGCAPMGGASIGCDQLSASPTYESQRRRNTVEALLRYRDTYGSVGLATTLAYIGSDHVRDNGVPSRPVQFRGLDLVDAGLAVTYAGATVGGHVLYGQGNNNLGALSLNKVGGKPELAWMVGASYTIGPVIVGASYVDVTSEGSLGNLTTGADTTGQRREQGVVLGSTYSVAPGLALFTQALWDQRKEGGYNFINNTLGNDRNKTSGQVFGIGSSFAW